MRIEDDHIASVIRGKETILPDPVKKTILDSTSRHAGAIIDKLREIQVDLRSTPAIFIGGGSILFKRYIETSPMVAKAEFVLDPKANAIGYGMLATGQMQKISVNGGNNGNAQ
jgi:plasmid segregation protein ParM